MASDGEVSGIYGSTPDVLTILDVALLPLPESLLPIRALEERYTIAARRIAAETCGCSKENQVDYEARKQGNDQASRLVNRSLPLCIIPVYAVPVPVNESVPIELYKPQKLLSIGDTMSAANSVVQDTDTLWLKRRVGGASIPTLQNLDTDILAYDTKENQGDEQIIVYQWKYVILIVIIVIAFVYLCNHLGLNRHSRRKRIILRIFRAIRALVVRRISAQM
ncbi:uncharacterized protein LOC143894757 [Temnothorax americanus]|uniref:uncharacterized protein LOC143894757 n=1 Tax=Temnothorax americanus TaxID=1964332 RepID=UPI004067DBE1